ncbi:MAG: FAD-dependent oxidoreductase [Candidatus Aenigmarchaeota archaeon]|nr:FAD-dependent oxidoreductase [Candidatus Aenigmarchaeota archaeon]
MAYDLIIIGAGPAGIAATIYAARKKMKTLVISESIGGQAAWSSQITNYPGFQFITGPELAQKFEEHVNSFGLEVLLDKVTSAEKKGGLFEVKTEDSTFTARTLLIALGRSPRKLNVAGEEELFHKGITYCATCDGPLYKGKTVAVIGGGNSALDAALQMTKIANKVYLIDKGEKISGDAIVLDKIKASGKVEIFSGAFVREIAGSRFVEKIKISSQESGEKELGVGGVFIEIGSAPANLPFNPEGALKINERGEIIVNDRCETSVGGLFAAGDVTSIPEKQIIIAAGQGAMASISAFKYLARKPEEN